jgi:hypothetical protein
VRARVAVGALLFASLALNVWLLALGDGPHHADEVAHAAAAASPTPDLVAQACAPCEAKLDKCRNASFAAVAQAIQKRAGAVAALDEAPPDGEGAKVVPAADPAMQQDALCQIAREHLRRHWEGAEDDILQVVRRDLTDPGKQRDDLERDVGVFTGVLALSGDDAARFGEAYAAARAKHVDVARAAIVDEPPDWGAVLDAAKALYIAEDALAKEWGGADGRDRLRLSQVEKRTAILAILATYDGRAWQDGISW